MGAEGGYGKKLREQRTQKRQQIAATGTDFWLASLLVYGKSLLDLSLQPAESFLMPKTVQVFLTEPSNIYV